MSTNSTKKNTDLRNIGVFLLIACLVVIAIFVSGCSVPAAAKPDPSASSAAAPEQEPVVEEDSGTLAFGETITYDDGVSASVSAPAEFVPGEYSAGAVAGQVVLAFEFVITNNSTEPFDPSLVMATASSGGSEASAVFDVENEVNFPPMTKVLPGQTIKWVQAWSVADASAVTLEVNVGFTHEAAIYTNIK